MQRFLEREEPLPLREIRGRALLGPGAHHRVVVQIERVDHPARVAHHDFRPAVVLRGGPRGDPEGSRLAVRGQEGDEALIDVGIVLGRHVPAAAPALVPDAPESHAPGARPPVAAPQIGHRTHAVEVHVLPPLRHFLGCAAPDVPDDEWRGADPADQLEVLVRAEAVVLGDAAPRRVDDLGALRPWTDAVLPVIRVGKAAARPPEIRYLDPPQRGDHVGTQVPLLVRALDPKAVVDVAPQMLGELTVDVAADRVARRVGVDHQSDRVHRVAARHVSRWESTFLRDERH